MGFDPQQWKKYRSTTSQGRKVTVYYNPKTDITVIDNYAPARSLVFYGKYIKALEDGMKPNPNFPMACLVESDVLDTTDPEEILKAGAKK